MSLPLRLITILLLAALSCQIALADNKQPPADEIPTDLLDYVARPEPVFSWKLAGKQQINQGMLYRIELVSQTWQNIVWKHVLHIHEPVNLRHPKHVLLYVQGGSNGRQPGRGAIEHGLGLAELAGARVAMLYQVPNQPLLGGHKEDDLITETWLRYLDSGDPTWPLLFPMVKSAVKAMDAIEALSQSVWNQPVKGFVITGGSKRGWTSWLTPVADSRVIATAPIVIDVLNFLPQMKHQIDTWGAHSEQIDAYTRKGLVKQAADETPRDAQLRRMMDPYTYRSLLPLPKLLINGTNDRYWVVDAMKLYWHDLSGPKYVLQVPNAGHSLKGGRELALRTLAAFFQHVVTETPLPVVEWNYADTPSGGIRLELETSAEPRAVRFWTANSPTKDFREATWRSRLLEASSQQFVGEEPRPKAGHLAVYGELEYEFEGLRYSLATLIRRE